VHADPATLTFDLTVREFVEPVPELADGVFGQTPEIGATMRAVVRIKPTDVQSDASYGTYYGTSFGTYNVGFPMDLSLGSSTLHLVGSGSLQIGNDVDSPIISPEPLIADTFDYYLVAGAPSIALMEFGLFNYTLPTSTFASDAIPPAHVLNALRFFMAVTPRHGDECADEDCPSFGLTGTAAAVQSPAPVPEPGT